MRFSLFRILIALFVLGLNAEFCEFACAQFAKKIDHSCCPESRNDHNSEESCCSEASPSILEKTILERSEIKNISLPLSLIPIPSTSFLLASPIYILNHNLTNFDNYILTFRTSLLPPLGANAPPYTV